MKKLAMAFALCAACLGAAFGGDEEVTVKVSVAGTSANTKLKKACEVAGKKAAVKKYLQKMDSKMPEKLIADAVASYAKFVDDIETDEQDFEDGELTSAYTVTIKQAELGKWLQGEGYNPAATADGGELSLVILEDPPSAGSMKVADAFGTGLDGGAFFFTKYQDFQKEIRGAIKAKVQEFGFEVKDLTQDDAYNEFKKNDRELVGVYFDPGVGEKGDFKIAEDFVNTVRDNNPDTLVLYYRISNLVYEKAVKKIRVGVALEVKNLRTGKSQEFGSLPNHAMISNGTQVDAVMADFCTATKEAMNSVLNAGDAAAKLQHIVKSMRAAAERPAGPMKLVVNASKIDAKIRTRAKVQLKKALIEAGLTDQKSVKIQGNTITATITKTDIPDADELWVAVLEVLDGVGIEADDEQKSFSNGVLTVTPGK